MTKLAAWFPLHKDNNDWSGNGNHLTAPYGEKYISREVGVIGASATVENAGSLAHYKSPPMGLNGDHAMFCFLKVKQIADVSSANGVLGCHNHSEYSGTGITLKALSDTTFAISVNTGHGTHRSFHSYYGETELNINEWHHVGFVWESFKRTLSIYVDGKLDRRITNLSEMVMNPNAPVALFCWSLPYVTSGSYRPAQSIQDVRIYNEAPTAKEIKDISKGCVLHLPMNTQSFGSVVPVEGFSAYHQYAVALEERPSYVKAKIIREGTLAIRPLNFSATEKRVRISGFAYRNGEPINVTSITTYKTEERIFSNKETGWFCSELMMTGTWVIHTNGGLDFPKLDDIYEFKGLKIECLSSPTGNNGNLRDSSGLKNDCLASSDLPQFCQVESNLGTGAYYFDNDLILSKEKITIGGNNQVTLATWFKASSAGYDNYHPLLTLDGLTYELNINHLGQLRVGFHIDGVRQVENYGSGGLLDGEWHHVAATYDGKTTKAYIDGVIVGESQHQGFLSTSPLHIQIGQTYKEKSRYSSKDLYQSDALIFGTALSSEEIKNLFRQRLTIDKKGNIYPHSATENAGITRVSRRGELIAPKLAENNYKPSIIDYSSWVIGQKQADKFGRNGAYAENIILVDKNPCGFDDVVWQAQQVNSTPDADGGWNTARFPINKDKAYRFTCWFNRKVLGSGAFYFGTHGYDESGNAALENLGGGINSNPYFCSGTPPVTDEWFLVVGYIYPAGTTAEAFNDSGVYNTKGEKLRASNAFRWASTATESNSRSYLYYSSSIDTIQQFYRPRVDLVDGQEPSLGDLLKCKEHTPLINFYNKNNAYSANSHSLGKHVVAKNIIEI